MQPSTSPTRKALSHHLFAALSAGGNAGLDWLEDARIAVAATSADQVADALARPFAGARRRVGNAPLCDLGPRLATPCGAIATAGWGRDDAARACLLLTALDTGAEPPALVDALFRAGDERERAALIKALCLLPEPARALATARAAGRSNSMLLYAALALENPYPACCYDERDFNQVILKCLFSGLPISRVTGLQSRANPSLSRMCEDYHDERIAAGRTLPADIWLALVPHAGDRGLALACRQLDANAPGHATYAAQALSGRRDITAVRQALDGYAQRQ
ncbi:EboA domain-containing protein [Thiohalocapsa sp. ML1]|jgi:hypothetical protein|uniref:EboA domain-containing protein n=1 Tax=Thiohalocapsa sp. ML1 TaxID=1431688 RepID=UPI000731F668|nr:EboA domain-containing protein [Thiohalocapsa sp. ML1]